MNESEIRKWWDIFKNNGKLTEIRILDGKKTYSGYYKNIDNIIRDIAKYDNANVYFTLNCIDDACYGRTQNEHLEFSPKTTTSDNDIIGRDFIMVDIDPIRRAGTNSSEQELEYAHRKCVDIYRYLMNNGFYEPIVAMSGNGYHLHIPVAMKASDENTKLVKRFLYALAMMFTDANCDIDLKVYNNSRICKLFGTISNKGANIHDRPKRCSRIVKVPDEIKINSNEYIQKIADLYPDEHEPKTKYNNYGTENFNLDEFIQKYNIKVERKIEVADGTKYILSECIFDNSHKAPDAMIFRNTQGAISYYCFHATCSKYKWQDVRLKFEPNAYDKKDVAEFRHKQLYYGNFKREPFQPQQEDETKGKKWLDMTDIKYVDMSTMVAIPTGYEALDKKIMGLLMGDVTILSGISGSGKTSWLDCLILNIIQRGFNVACWSGELQSSRFQGWITQIAAGKNYVKKKEGYDNFYYAPKNICDKINPWLKDKLKLYNNEYGNKFAQIFADMKACVEEFNIQLVILDNLASLNLVTYDGDKNSQQAQFINDVKEYAKKKNIHVVLVCHPRKEISNSLLRKESISGSADLTNICDNLFILHRVGNDFEKRASEFWGADRVNEYMKYDTVIEVCKNRSFGIVDFVVGMYYEVESRRLKNSISEHIIYGWQEQPTQPMINIQDDNIQDVRYEDMDDDIDFEMTDEQIPF